jgi:hypothetical protein
MRPSSDEGERRMNGCGPEAGEPETLSGSRRRRAAGRVTAVAAADPALAQGVGAENYVTPPDQRLRGRPRDRRPATGDQHDRSLWPSDSPTSRSDAC